MNAPETIRIPDVTAYVPSTQTSDMHSGDDVLVDAESPTGAVGGMVRPGTSASQRIAGSLASLGLDVGDREPTVRPEGNCYCE